MALLLFACLPSLASADGPSHPDVPTFPSTTTLTLVRVRVVDIETSRPTPAMFCLTDSDGRVRVPPDGRIVKESMNRDPFYTGIEFSLAPNWIGPVRDTLVGRRRSVPYWTEPAMYQMNGELTFLLPPGRWRAAADHGMEFIPAIEEFQTHGEPELQVTLGLRRWIDLTRLGWWSGDVHVHHPTQFENHREFLLQYARAADVHVVNVLEMGDNQGTYFKQAGFGARHRAHKGDYWLVSGQEDPRVQSGHIIGLNLSGMVRDPKTYDLCDLAVAGIKRQRRALSGYAHFAWDGPSIQSGFVWITAVETPHFVELLQFAALNWADYYEYLNLGFRLTAAAGSDVPWGSTLGEARTFVHTGPTLDIEAWFDGLAKGHTFVSNGPFIELRVDGHLPGETLRRSRRDSVHILARTLSAPHIGPPMELSIDSNEGPLAVATNPDGRMQLTLELDYPTTRSRWITARTLCRRAALAGALTTPVYILVDGQPHWSRALGPALAGKRIEELNRVLKQVRSDGNAPGNAPIVERLERAKVFYQRLQTRMMEQAGTASVRP
ncbi:MAG: hypothetical protein Kow0059_07670 [Candidatus Sumerlaeia bacterium]